MTRSKWVYWLFVGTITGAVFIALVFTALGYVAAMLWEGVLRLYRYCLPRPSGA
ncbi:MAG: hypothetical protein R6U88_01170 [Candidatus Bipolaricaulota bacterium]